MSKIRICEVMDSYLPCVDGVVNVIKNYSENLNKVEICKLAVPSADKKQNYVDSEDFEVIRCKSVSAPENYRQGLPNSDGDFVKKMESENFDIIHTHSPFTMGRFALKLGKKKHIPVVATLHTQYHQDFERVLHNFKPLVKFMINYIMKVYNGADSVWTVSNASCKFLREYGYKGDIQVVRNGTEFTYPDNPDELIEHVNKKHNLYGQKNVFAFIGRMALYKNLYLLCDALKILKDNGVDFKMLFVGGGFDYDKVVSYIEELGLNDRCIMVGSVLDRKELQGYYLRSDLLLFPSVFDMASVTKIEAAAHKLATVTIKDSCSAELVEDGVNGFLSEESAESFANKIMEIEKDQSLYRTVGENAYKTLYRTWEDVAREVDEKYKTVIAQYKRKQEIIKRAKAIKIAKAKPTKKTGVLNGHK